MKTYWIVDEEGIDVEIRNSIGTDNRKYVLDIENETAYRVDDELLVDGEFQLHQEKWSSVN